MRDEDGNPIGERFQMPTLDALWKSRTTSKTKLPSPIGRG
jgi:hypothetical protein